MKTLPTYLPTCLPTYLVSQKACVSVRPQAPCYVKFHAYCYGANGLTDYGVIEYKPHRYGKRIKIDSARVIMTRSFLLIPVSVLSKEDDDETKGRDWITVLIPMTLVGIQSLRCKEASCFYLVSKIHLHTTDDGRD